MLTGRYGDGKEQRQTQRANFIPPVGHAYHVGKTGGQEPGRIGGGRGTGGGREKGEKREFKDGRMRE